MTGLTGSALKQKLRGGRPVLGAWLTVVDPLAANVMARLGFDFLLIDLEHAPITIETLQTMLLMFDGTQTAPIVRVPANDPVWIKHALDLGAEGILVPLIRTASETASAVAAARYPPDGIRGFGPRAASGFYRDVVSYKATANERIAVIAQIEHVDAVENLLEILSTVGLDAVFIGPGDLSSSMGIFAEWQNPRLISTIEEIIEKARSAGMPIGMAVDSTAEDALRRIAQGISFVTLGVDWAWMREGAASFLAAVRDGSTA